jgi:hypothetical protein
LELIATPICPSDIELAGLVSFGGGAITAVAGFPSFVELRDVEAAGGGGWDVASTDFAISEVDVPMDVIKSSDWSSVDDTAVSVASIEMTLGVSPPDSVDVAPIRVDKFTAYDGAFPERFPSTKSSILNPSCFGLFRAKFG